MPAQWRYPYIVPLPAASTVLIATCGERTSLGWLESVAMCHFGEDGPMPVLVQDRGIFLSFNERSADLQEWAAWEQWDMLV